MDSRPYRVRGWVPHSLVPPNTSFRVVGNELPTRVLRRNCKDRKRSRFSWVVSFRSPFLYFYRQPPTRSHGTLPFLLPYIHLLVVTNDVTDSTLLQVLSFHLVTSQRRFRSTYLRLPTTTTFLTEVDVEAVPESDPRSGVLSSDVS